MSSLVWVRLQTTKQSDTSAKMKRDESTVVNTNGRRVDGHTFESGYSLHDVAEAHVTRYVEHIGFRTEQWGINRRQDKHVLGDDKMDLKVYDDDELCALLEIKSKRSDSWYGTINRDHFVKYLKQVHDHAVPAFIYMSVGGENDDSIVKSVFLEIEPWGELVRVRNGAYEFYQPEDADDFLWDQVNDHPLITGGFNAPDGKPVVNLDIDQGVCWSGFTAALYSV